MALRPLPASHSAVLIAALALSGCFREPDPFTVDSDDVAVHVILEAGADSVLALVERPGDPVEDAVVRLIAGADTMTLSFSSDPCTPQFYSGGPHPGCHRAYLANPVQAGATYELEIDLPDGGQVTGTTHVPLPLALQSPEDGERITAECQNPIQCYGESVDYPPFNLPVAHVVFRWTGEREPGRLDGVVRATTTFLAGEEFEPEEGGCQLGYRYMTLDRAGADSLSIGIPNIYCQAEALRDARFDSIQARALAFVWNEALHEYLEALEFGGSTRAGHVSVGLEGAWGVFGAITPTERRITIVRDPAPAPAAAAP